MKDHCRQPHKERRGLTVVISATLGLLLLFLAPGLSCPASSAASQRDLLHYEILVSFEPDQRRLQARTEITVPPDYPRRFVVALHRGLDPRAEHPEVELAATDGTAPGHGGQSRGLELFTVTLPPEVNTFVIAYGGEIHHPLGFAGHDYARGGRHTPGRIDAEGIYLGPGTYWYPRPMERPHFISFRLRAELPEGWTAVSQGRRHEPRPEVVGNETVWEELNPQQGAFLVADRYTVYQDRAAGVSIQAFLREPDEELARRYLDATADYLERYSEMIGPYPYAKFALVENFWESGFGMPSFTLLGPRVIRLPFILHSSYPHEILHNWWGNSVYADYARGNWTEGLTSHLADHLLMEERGRGVEYRRRTLQRYADYAAGDRDFPLRQFSSRQSPADEAVGYGKAMMMFHMLEQKLGQELFLKGLGDFYRENLFQLASFDDIKRSLEQRSEGDLEIFFDQWLERAGAPELVIEEVQLAEHDDGWRLRATFGQQQPGPPYRLLLPVRVTLEGEEEPRNFRVAMAGDQLDWQADFSRQPRHLALDPGFDLFRLLDRQEIPPALSSLFGAEDDLLVIIPEEEEQMLPAYRELAGAMARFGSAGVEVVKDSELESLPAERESVILGWKNKFQPQASKALEVFDDAELLTIGRDLPAGPRPGALQVAEQAFSRAGHAFALALPHPDNPATTLGWIAMDSPEMVSGLLRRLPHYHSYGAVVFQGPQAENIFSHHWPAHDSPLHRNLDALIQ